MSDPWPAAADDCDFDCLQTKSDQFLHVTLIFLNSTQNLNAVQLPTPQSWLSSGIPKFQNLNQDVNEIPQTEHLQNLRTAIWIKWSQIQPTKLFLPQAYTAKHQYQI